MQLPTPRPVVPHNNPYAYALANPERIAELAKSLGMAAPSLPAKPTRATPHSIASRFKAKAPSPVTPMPSLPTSHLEPNLPESSRGGAVP